MLADGLGLLGRLVGCPYLQVPSSPIPKSAPLCDWASFTPHSWSFLLRAGSGRLPRAQPTQRTMRDGRHRYFQPLHFGSGSQRGMVLPLEVTFEHVWRRFCLSHWRVGVLVSPVGRARGAAACPAVRGIAGPETSGMLRSRNLVPLDHHRFLVNASRNELFKSPFVRCFMPHTHSYLSFLGHTLTALQVREVLITIQVPGSCQ